MVHYFDVDIATKYGIPSAVMLQNIYYWVTHAKANGENCFDGNYWTRNSKRAFAELFPYMTERQIDTALKKLIDDGIIITGNYNKFPWDRSLWYAITEKGFNVMIKSKTEATESGTSIRQKCEMDATTLSNGRDTVVEPIPNINININRDINDNNIYPPCASRSVDAQKQGSENLPLEKSAVELTNKAPKHKYGKYNNVLLTDDEYEKLNTEPDGGEAIQYLSEYIEMKGYKAKSHYLAIRKWVFDAIKEMEQRRNRLTQEYRPQGEEKVMICGKEYIKRGDKYYIPGGSGIAVDPYMPDDLPY